MFCPQANLVAPFASKDGTKAQILQDTDGDGQHDVILEKDDEGNTFLHLVMPASAVNFLNGHDSNSLFEFAADERQEQYPKSSQNTAGGVDDVFVELGCKVYEVNKVYYRGHNKEATTPMVLNSAAL